MKKILIAFAIASMFAACSNSETKTNTTTDITGLKVDTSTTLTADTSHKMDTTSKMSVDTSHSKK